VSDLRSPKGFEESLPASPRHRRAPTGGASAGSNGDQRAALLRIINRAPQVVVKVSGRAHGRSQLRTRLDYISRKGELEMEDQHGSRIIGRSDVRELADDWSLRARIDHQRRADSPISHSVVLSTPSGTDPVRLVDAARETAREAFGGRFDYVFVLHTDVGHPHIHLEVSSRGDRGVRLEPYPNLEGWRHSFAQALREHGVDAEATPRWIRGVTRRAEHTAIRKMREAYEAGEGPPPKVLLGVYQDAYKAAFGGEAAPNQWEEKIIERQSQVRDFFHAQIEALAKSPDPTDQALGRQVEAFVRSMPRPDSQRLAIARQILATDAPRHRQDMRMGAGLDQEPGQVMRKGRSLKMS
jgi:hypothetical protein